MVDLYILSLNNDAILEKKQFLFPGSKVIS